MPLEIDERCLGRGVARIRLEYALIPRQSFIDLSLADGDGGQPQQRIDVVYVTNTNTTFAPTHILLPPAQRNLLSSAILPFGGNMTLLQYLEANLVSGRSGRVQFVPDLSLKGAGAGGVDRMMVYTRSEETAKFHLPMGFNFQAPYQDTALSWFIPGILRTGGTEIRVPKAHAYFDGV